MGNVTVFVDEVAVTVPKTCHVDQAIREYLFIRDPDLIKFMEHDELYVVDPCGHLIEDDDLLRQGMRLYVRRKSAVSL